MTSFDLFAEKPAKVIISGEHSVVYGFPAIASSIEQTVRIWYSFSCPRAENGTHAAYACVQIALPNLGYSLQSLSDPDLACVTPVLQKLCSRSSESSSKNGTCSTSDFDGLKDYPSVDKFSSCPGGHLPILLCASACLVPENNGGYGSRVVRGTHSFVIDTDVPFSSGLGSSAAFNVALAHIRVSAVQAWAQIDMCSEGPLKASLLDLDTDVLKAVNSIAFRLEHLVHGTPSGLDNFTSCYGGLVVMRDRKPSRLHLTKGSYLPCHLIVDTRQPRSTKELVQRVRENPECAAIMRSIGQCTDQVISALLEGKRNAFFSAIRENQQLLKQAGVSHPKIDEIVFPRSNYPHR